MSPCYLPDGTGMGFNSFPEQSFSGGTCHASGLTLLWCGARGRKWRNSLIHVPLQAKQKSLWWGKDEESPFCAFEGVIMLLLYHCTQQGSFKKVQRIK